MNVYVVTETEANEPSDDGTPSWDTRIAAIKRDADRAIRSLLLTYPTHQYEVLEALASALVSRSYSLGEECATHDPDGAQ